MAITKFLLLLSFIASGYSYDPPMFINGRPRGGFVGTPWVEKPELLRNIADQWFTQKLDHFEDDLRTWKQRYFVNTQRFTPKGPVFLMIGGEGRLSSRWLSVGSMAEYAKANGALMFGLEHRYYGKSHPSSDSSVSNLKHLSSEQALADIATFRQAMVKKYKLTEENKWIVFGGSYPGNLAAWFRYKYPHLAYGAIASSAPVKAKLNFPEYLEVSTASLSNDECRANVKQATATIERMLKSGNGLRELSKKFRTCTRLTTNPDDLMQFTSFLVDTFVSVIQYNRDNRAEEGFARPNNINVRMLCGIMNNKKLGDVVDRYANINKMLMTRHRRKCLDISYAKYLTFMRETSWHSGNAGGARQWVYQTCTEFGYFQTTESTRQVFGTTVPLSFFLKQCVDIYGKTFNKANNKEAVDWSNSNYGGYALARSASRIIFPNGSIDPWHALSLLKSEGNIIAIYINGTSHCANMYPSSPTDSREVKHARHKIATTIKQWLSESQ